MVFKPLISQGAKLLTKNIGKKGLQEATDLLGRQTVEALGETFVRNPEKAITFANAYKVKNYKVIRALADEASETASNARQVTQQTNFISGKKPDLAWVGDRKTSKLSQAGMRKNMLQYGYTQRQVNPDIAPAEMLQGFRDEMGTTAFQGKEQKFVSGGSKPTKQTDISEAGQRKLQIQGLEQNKARRQKNIQERNEHGYTSPEAKKSYNKQNKEVTAENKQAVKDAKAQGIKVKPGQQFVSLEHDIALSHGRKWWKKVGNIGNDPENLFIQRNQLARQFKDNIENWFYPKSKDFIIKSDRSNLKDLIIMSVETGQEVLRIPMPDDFATGIPDNIIRQLQKLLGK